MITINLRNIEEILFHNSELQEQFPEFRHYFDQWKLAKQHAFLKQIGKQAVIDLLNNLSEDHLEIISNYFNSEITIDKFNNRIVNFYQFDIDQISEEIENIQEFGNIFLHRDENQVYLGTWR
jgi:hypothetical protein